MSYREVLQWCEVGHCHCHGDIPAPLKSMLNLSLTTVGPGFLLTMWKTQLFHLQVTINKESLQVTVKVRRQWQNSRQGKNMTIYKISLIVQ